MRYLIICLIALASVAYAEEECDRTCTGSRWVLHVDGEPIEVGDLTQDECMEIAAQIDPGPPFSDIIKCVEEQIQRLEM